MCLILYKQKEMSEEVQSIATLKFVGNFLRLDVGSMISLNKNIESSICLILGIIINSAFFVKHKSQGMLKLFKQSTL